MSAPSRKPNVTTASQRRARSRRQAPAAAPLPGAFTDMDWARTWHEVAPLLEPLVRDGLALCRANTMFAAPRRRRRGRTKGAR